LKRREGGISKLLALGASTIMRYARAHGDRATPWQRGILARPPVKSLPPAKPGVAVLAQAAKTARIGGRPYMGHAGLGRNLSQDRPRGLMDNAGHYPQARPPSAAIIG
jgi:hypothetical protein